MAKILNNFRSTIPDEVVLLGLAIVLIVVVIGALLGLRMITATAGWSNCRSNCTYERYEPAP